MENSDWCGGRPTTSEFTGWMGWTLCGAGLLIGKLCELGKPCVWKLGFLCAGNGGTQRVGKRCWKARICGYWENNETVLDSYPFVLLSVVLKPSSLTPPFVNVFVHN